MNFRERVPVYYPHIPMSAKWACNFRLTRAFYPLVYNERPAINKIATDPKPQRHHLCSIVPWHEHGMNPRDF